jgi:hypothetical protein
MKNTARLLTIASLTILCVIAASGQLPGDQSAGQSARGLYVGYEPKKTATSGTAAKKTGKTTGRTGRYQKKPSPPKQVEPVPAPTGLPGTKVTIELQRDGKTSEVAPNYQFRSGDRIRLRMQTNFEGYVSLVNVGSSGTVQTLYPADGIARPIYPSRDFLVPESGVWIKFDDTPGVELLTVVMSSKPLAGSRDGYSELRKANSRDLTIEYTGDSVYAVYPEEGLSSKVGFTLKLNHGR